MTPEFDQKVEEYFAAYIYHHFTMSLLDRMMGQSFLDYLNLLHPQGVTLEDAEDVILDVIMARVSCKFGVADKGSLAICVVSACCSFTAILQTGTVYLIGAAVCWT